MRKTTEIHCSLPHDTARLHELREQVNDLIAQTPWDERTRHRVVLAIDEAVSAPMLEKQSTSGSGLISVDIELTESCLKVKVTDSLLDFDDRADQTIEHSRRHKLGIFLMRRIMDEVSYSYTRGFTNELTLLKIV